jgi:hypothetical protein
MGMEKPAAPLGLLPERGAVVAAEIEVVDVEEVVEVLEWLEVEVDVEEGAWVVPAEPAPPVAADPAAVEVVLVPIKPDPAPPELEPPDPEPVPAVPSGQEVVGSAGS